MPPPKPGVIPLAPLKLGDILGGAFSAMGRYWKQLFGIGVTVYGGALVIVGAAALIAYSATSDHLHHVISLSAEEDPASADVVPLGIGFGVVWLVAMIVFMVSTAMMYATVPAILQEAVLGRPTTFGVIWRRAWARVPAVIGTVVLSALIAMIPMVLAVIGFVTVMIGAITLSQGSGTALWTSLGFLGALATAPLAAWLWVKFCLAPSAVVFEGQGPVAGVRRSSQLVRGDWWRVFGITLLALLMAAVASYVIQIPFSFLGMFSGVIGGATLADDPNPASILFAMSGYLVIMALGQLIGQLVSTTFPPLVTGLLYVDRRIRTENLGPALAEAAATPPPPPYGTHG
ncbi:hypothetical protein OG497_29885 [Streptomyces sp. NBC_01242]|uniref:DUF7847 domain-containing protein n=1 Tax=unclassified Streptomyces TaxID=2593676 RepID=UPI00225669CA|nr:MULTISPECIES: hypothetical protein [unclassified Streptomyces]MCX4798182.1 hypothetical protein [Streptomyces sp. NBC_01242]WSJ39430.1 hypothetical protein OG772_27755 [Streptomyces sp. NBC_01321]WSP54429.1 hypothetical protein OG306_08600 [Streptomyces sp. NBC_01241]WSU24896.1 hypothetical protein OG508_30745 [Streptomyces sp. NBC_01108]